MVRLAGPTRPDRPDLAVLEPMRLDAGEPTRPAGAPPYLAPGEVLTYRYGYFAAPLRVVRDDELGLVAWLPEGSEQLARDPARRSWTAGPPARGPGAALRRA